MKILNLKLIAFGCFTDTELLFEDAGPNFHVIYGPNEAGKSTTLRAIMGLFFGIPHLTSDAFQHDPKQLRVGAELLLANGERRLFIRRKGHRDTLLGPDEKPVPEADLAAYLGRMSEEAFAAMFCINHETLVRGGRELLAGKGELAASLFQAGTGVVGLHQVLADLETDAEKLFKPRGQLSTLNRAITAFEEARKRSRELAVAPRDWKERAEALARMSAELEQLKGQLRQLQAERARLERHRFALPKYVQQRQLLEARAQLGPVLRLPETARSERESAQQQRHETVTRIERIQGRLHQWQQEYDNLTVSNELLAQAEPMNSLLQRLDGYRNAVRDLPKVRAEQERFESEARELLAELKPGHALDQAEVLRLSDIQRQLIARLANDFPRLQERQQNAQRQMDKIRTHLELSRQELDQCPAPPDRDELENALARARKQGDLETQFHRETQQGRGLEQQAERDLKKLGLWTGSLEELEHLPLPLPQTIDAFETELTTLQNQQAQLTARGQEILLEQAHLERDLETLQLSGEVPTEQYLRETRERREQGWQLVRQAWLDHAPNPEAEQAFDPHRPLPEAYEQSVTDADQVADRLRREAERCAHLAKLTASRRECDRRQKENHDELEALQSRLAQWQQRWQALWQAARIQPLSPKEMRSWQSNQTLLVSRLAEIRLHRNNLHHLQEILTDCSAALATALEHINPIPILNPVPNPNLNPTPIPSSPEKPPSPKSFATLLQQADSVLRKLSEARQHRLELEKTVKRLDKELKSADSDLQQVKQALAHWQHEWQQALVPLHLPGSTRPEEATLMLAKLDRLFNALRECHSRHTRAKDMEHYSTRFTSEVTALTRALAPELATLPAEPALAKLQAQLTQTQQHHTKRQAIEKQIAREKEALAQAREDQLRAEAQLQTCLARAKCATLEELEMAERKSEQASRLDAQMEQNTRDLAGFTAGSTLEVLQQELAAVNGDELPGRIQELDHQISALEADRSKLEQQVAIDREKLRASDGSALAAAAAEEAQGALAIIREGTEQYVRLRLAAEVLRRQMERYREQNQDPIIRRASEIFPQLTRGSFARLKTDVDEQGQAILLGVRSSGEEVAVTGMSDGTRDQLFLALRLASLERQFTAAEPLPLIVDDILINFDDARAQATLEQFAELAQKTQVLFFTHHHRLVDLATSSVSQDILKVHQLSPSGAPLPLPTE